MKTDILLSELQFKAVRSSGAGGQNVNKVSSKVVLTFNLNNSKALSEEERENKGLSCFCCLIRFSFVKNVTNKLIIAFGCQMKGKGVKKKPGHLISN